MNKNQLNSRSTVCLLEQQPNLNTHVYIINAQGTTNDLTQLFVTKGKDITELCVTYRPKVTGKISTNVYLLLLLFIRLCQCY